MKYQNKILFLSLATLGLATADLQARAETLAAEADLAVDSQESGWNADAYEAEFFQAAVAKGKKNNVPGRPPRGGSSYSSGSNQYYSDGTSSYSSGSNTYYSGGGSSYSSGSNTYYSDGTSSYTSGSNTYYSNGTSSYTSGSNTYYSDGTSCYTSGSNRYCS